jgi:TPR repeat protein
MRGALAALAWLATEAAEARPRCPEGMWLSGGSCCAVGSEYVPAKNQCMPVRAERRCVAGHLDDCVSAARELEQRGASSASYSAELYRYACEEGYAPACRGLGSLYHRGLGLDRDEARARVLYEESCDGGDAPGCTVLAKLLLEEGSDAMRADELLAQACHRGDADACDVFARRLSANPAQLAQSIAYLERACDGGIGRACRNLVEIAHQQQYVEPVREQRLLELACRASDPVGCTLLGDALREGNIVPKNLVLAALRYRSACEAGHGLGCMRLGELTSRGDGVTRDLTQAAELFGRACLAGEPLACERAAAMQSERSVKPARSVSRAP